MNIGRSQDVDDPRISNRTVERKLGDFFSTGEEKRQANYSDKEIQQISDLLRAVGRQQWSTVPRIYIVLRHINQLELLDTFIDQGITDIWLPFTERTLPDTLSPSRRAQFLACQSVVLTKALDLENEDHRKHTHFSQGEPLPFEVKTHLGSGGYGTVDKVISLLSYREYARKTFKRGRNFSRAKEDIKSFLNEIQVLKRVQHIHCIELIGSYTDPKYFAFIMSPVADWNMAIYMSLAANSADKRSLLRNFFGCLTNGLQYLHGSRIRHRDIKPENILIKGDRALLSDFGIALDWEHLSRSTTTADTAKSLIYCAPEVAQYHKRNSSSDIWSLGCVFLEMITVLKGETITAMRTFFKDRNDHYRFYGNIETTKEWMEMLQHLSTDGDNEPLNWITRMLDQKPESRPTASTLFADINRTPTNVLVLFCGSCCRQDEDSSDGFDSDGELWADDREYRNAKTKSNASKPKHMSASQLNSADRRIPSHSPVPLQTRAGMDGPTNEAIKEATKIHDQGVVYDEQGRLAEAEVMYEQALARREKVLGREHKSTLETIHNLGTVYWQLGRMTEAEAMYKQVLTGSEKVLGPEHKSTFDAAHNLGAIYEQWGRMTEAEAMYKRALVGREKALGPEHKSTLETAHNLGTVYGQWGRMTEAEAMCKRALAGREKVLGPEHKSTLQTAHNLGTVYGQWGRMTEAEAMYKRALAGKEKALGPEHKSTLETAHNLGTVYGRQGRLAEAEAMYKRVLTGRENVLGPEHISTFETAHNLGTVYRQWGRMTEAEAMYKRALVGKEKVLDPEHKSTLDTAHNLGAVYSNQGRLAEAEAMYKRVLTGSEKVLGPEHKSTLKTVCCLGYIYSEQGRLPEAEAMYKRALAGSDNPLGPKYTLTLQMLHRLGIVYERQRRLSEAEAVYKRALAGREKVLGPEHTSTLQTVYHLSVVYGQQGKPSEAEAMYKRVLAGSEKSLGREHASTPDKAYDLAIIHKKQRKH